MRRRLGFALAIVVPIASVGIPAAAQTGAGGVRAPVVAGAVADRFVSVPLDRTRVEGLFGERLKVNLDGRLLHLDEHRILAGFKARPGEQDWIGEHAGKFLDAAANTWSSTHDARLKTLMDRVARELIATQDPDGYLGTYLEKDRWTSWDVWVHKYDLVGLLAYHRVTGDEAALTAARRVGDLLCRTFGEAPGQRDIVKAGEHVGMAATSVLEPMCTLYRFTGERRYLDFCLYLTRAYDEPNGPHVIRTLTDVGRVDKTANGKAYEMLSNLVGLVELYRITGDRTYLVPAVNAWEDVVARRLYVTGTASSQEHFRSDLDLPAEQKSDVGEGCVTVTWLQLTWQLLRVTGEARYADELERTVFNSLLGAQDPANGDICYFTPLDGKKPYASDISCCVSSEPRGISMIPELAWGARDAGVAVLLYTPGEATIATPGGDVRVAARTRFPADGAVALTIDPGSTRRFPVFLRVPAWTDRYTATVGGERFVGKPGELLAIERAWAPGDEIHIEMAMTVRLLPGGPSYPNRVAVARGPQVLALDGAPAPDGDARLVALASAARPPRLDASGASYTTPAVVGTVAGARASRRVALVPFADAREPRVWLATPRTLAAEAAALRAGPSRQRATAAQVARAPRIDGLLDEPAWRVDVPVTREAIGTHDDTVTFGALWDATYLYVGVEVLDASLNDDGPRTWESDSVEVYVDGDRNRAAVYDARDTQLVLVWKGTTVTRNGGGEAPGVLGACAAREGGYTMEFAIPWARLGVTPAAGTTIGFDLSNNDNDGGGHRASKLMWSTPNDDAWRDTSEFGDLVLGAAARAKRRPAR